MSDIPIAHKLIDLYAKIDGEEIPAGKLAIPIHVDYTGELNADKTLRLRFRVGRIHTDLANPEDEGFKECLDRLKEVAARALNGIDLKRAV